ncbi:MAG TPA: branched-chain amino acid ABC transporter substrate-binding protein [Candidatus Dormibacteraeota bacterium]|nr:branched-chain amino acid ABC transporter substrate-binding protein [Candidatus Dormibacteraeota bacterium]
MTTQNGVQFAVNQRNAAGGVNGYTISFQGFDDCRQGAYSADAGVENVQSMMGDAKFLGMIGPFNSAVAKAEIPIAAPQHFTMVSPSNTNPCLTKEQLPPLPACSYHAADLRAGNPNNYFRVVTTDDYQGPAMADYAYKTLNVHTIGILDDSTVFGVGIAGSFEAEFKKAGGIVAKHSEYQKATTSDFKSILLSFKNAGAQGVYAGGTDDQNLCIPRKQMKDLGWDVPFMGGDGIETTDCINQAAGNEPGVYATTAGADATQIPGASATIAAFRKAFPGPNDFGGYTMQAYDAANALMNAIGRAVSDANGSVPTRDQVRAEMAKTKGFVGVIGTYDFDSNGDNNLKIVSIYVTKSVSDPAQSSGVCGKDATKMCFVWAAQVDFAKISG